MLNQLAELSRNIATVLPHQFSSCDMDQKMMRPTRATMSEHEIGQHRGNMIWPLNDVVEL
jgi:hypothetical protein